MYSATSTIPSIQIRKFHDCQPGRDPKIRKSLAAHRRCVLGRESVWSTVARPHELGVEARHQRLGLVAAFDELTDAV